MRESSPNNHQTKDLWVKLQLCTLRTPPEELLAAPAGVTGLHWFAPGFSQLKTGVYKAYGG